MDDLDTICYSGIISTSSQKGISDFFDKSTTISMTLKNPILTYIQEGISPRDLTPDMQLTYNHISNPNCAFPTIEIQNKGVDLDQYKEIIYQAYLASIKIHEVSELYDGSEYSEHALFFVDDKIFIRVYEIIGGESFLGLANCDQAMIREELDLIKEPPAEQASSDGGKPKIYTKNFRTENITS